jgi:hypothetical protein
MIFVICNITINPVVLGRKNVYKYCNVSRIPQFKMQFKVIASVLFFVAQIMATPTADNPSKLTHWGSDNCALSFMVLR